MLGILKLAGSKVTQTVVIALVVFWSLFFVAQQIKTMAVENLRKELQIEQLENEIDLRRSVDEILEENRETNPDRDGAIALERLCETYGRTCPD